MPVQLRLTAGTTADGAQAEELMAGIAAEYQLADRGCDTNAALTAARARGMEPVIPPQRNRKEPRDYARERYRRQHLVENGFCDFKEWRGLATR